MEIVKLGSVYADCQVRAPGFCLTGKEKVSLGDTVPGQELQWVQHKGIFVGDRCACVGINWKQLDKRGYIFGRPILIDGKPYLCRSLKVNPECPSQPSEWDDILDTYGDDSALWHCHGISFWGQDTPWNEPKIRAVRGYCSARFYNRLSAIAKDTHIGFRPVLEPLPPLDFEGLSEGTRLIVYHRDESIIEGTLTSFDDYDLVLADVLWTNRERRKDLAKKTMLVSRGDVVWGEVKS